MTVWIAVHHVHYEQDEILGVYATKEKAREKCKAYITERPWTWIETVDGFESSNDDVGWDEWEVK